MGKDKTDKVIDFSNDDMNFASLGINDRKIQDYAEYDDASRFEEITRKMAETYRIKSHDYGNSYRDSIRELGLIAGFVPILHKCNRMKNLVKGVEPQVAESLRDTVMDMANYLILFAMELDKMEGK